MRARTIFPIACLILLPVALDALAEKQRVYSWTDSQGVVHYSQFEPEKTPAQERVLNSSDPATPTTAPPAAPAKPKTFNQANCDVARTNLDNLSNGPADQLMTDKDGDGTPDPMSADDIAAAKDLAERQVKRFCESQ
jgi:hypothetical protein